MTVREVALATAFALKPVWDQAGNSRYSLIDDSAGLFEPEGIWKTAALITDWAQPILAVAEIRESADIYYCPGGLWILTARARQATQWTANNSAEFLPVTAIGLGTLHVLHPLIAVALAPVAEIHRNRVSGNITVIRKAAFLSKDVGTASVFYAAQPGDSASGRAGICCSTIFVNEQVARDLGAARITGIALVPTFTG